MDVEGPSVLRSATSAPPVPMDDAAAIGAGIRRERARRGWTLARLAADANLTVSALSQIERGVIDPSISSLRRISQALDVPMFRFLAGAERRHAIVRGGERVRITLPANDIEYELVTPDTAGAFEILALTMAPGATTNPHRSGHAAEECTVVLRGSIVAELGDEEFVLVAGDSVKIQPDLPHRYRNEGDVDAELLTTLSPPSF